MLSGIAGGGIMSRYMIWMLGAVACIYGAIAGSFFDHIPMSAVAFGLIAIIFVLAAYKDLSAKSRS